MTAPSEANKGLARESAKVFGGKPKVTRFWDDDHKSSVDLLSCEDRPTRGVTSYSTVGLSDWPLYRGDEEYPARLEMVGACATASERYANALATAAFCIINSQWFCYPGAIFPDILTMHEASSTMRHLFFVPPFLWETELETMTLESKTVAWLQAVPISEQERELVDSSSPDALETLFEEHEIDVFDLDRPSVV